MQIIKLAGNSHGIALDRDQRARLQQQLTTAKLTGKFSLEKFLRVAAEKSMPWFDASRIINQLRPGETEAAVTAILKLMGRPTPAAGAPKNEQHRSMIGQAAML